MDAEYHDQWATRIAAGEWIGEEVFFRAPLYPYFLGAIYALFGHDYYVARLIQLILGSVTCILVYLIGRQIFNWKVGLIASLIASSYGVLIYFDGELLITSLMTFVLLIAALMLLHTAERPSGGKWFASGLLVGLTALARANALILIPFVLLWLWWTFARHSRAFSKKLLFGWSALFVGGFLVVVLPVLVRNYCVGKDVVPIASQGGINFYIGNNPDSDGFTAIAPGTRPGWLEGYEDAIRIAEERAGGKLKPSQISDFWFSKGIDFITGEPGAYLRLLFKKLFLFWHGFELSNNKEIYFFTRYSTFLRAILWQSWLCFPFGLLSPLFFAGLFLAFKNLGVRKSAVTLASGIIGFYMVSVVAFFVCARFRVPIIPFLIAFASYGLYWFFAQIRARNHFGILTFLSFTLLCGFLLNRGFFDVKKTNPALMHYTVGTVYQRKERIEAAKREYVEALRTDPEFAKPYTNLGIIYSAEGDFEQAEQNFKKAISLDSSSEKAHFNLGTVYARNGEYLKAAEEYETALQIIPDYEDACYLAGLAYERLGMRERAIEKWEDCLRINPNSVRARRELQRMMN